MQIHQIQSRNKKEKRVGRGGKRGAYSGRGIKGQLSRAGHKKAPVIRELIKKYHKLRGYRFSPLSDKASVVNLSDLEKHFNSNEIVSPGSLADKGLVNKKVSSVKILATGRVNKPLVIKDCLLSSQAREKISKAGGKTDVQ